MVGGEPTTNQRENLNKSTTPNNNINRCFFRRLGGGGGGYCQGQKKRRTWTCQEKKDHINILELRAVKYAILTFSRLHPKARSLYIQMNSENKSLCVCHHIDFYLDKMKEFHKTEAQLLLSFIKPHKGVTTISRWILEVLHLSGINIEVFTGH